MDEQQGARNSMSANDSRAVSELFGDALSQFSKLVRNELHLARAEISVNAGEALAAVGLVAAAAILLIPTLALLLISLAMWLVEIGFRPSGAHLMAGLVGLLAVVILSAVGLNRLKTNSLVPKRTLDQLQLDAIAARDHVS
jgi:putative superfamily III holin-X